MGHEADYGPGLHAMGSSWDLGHSKEQGLLLLWGISPSNTVCWCVMRGNISLLEKGKSFPLWERNFNCLHQQHRL